MGLILKIENETRLPDGGPLIYRLTGKRNVDIGRDPHLDWALPDPTRYISGKHCEIKYRDGGYWLYDVSTNGTYLNDSPGRVQSPHLLRDGDRLTIGHYIVVVEHDLPDVQAPENAPSVLVAAPPRAEQEDLWEGGDDAAPPLDRKELNPAVSTDRVRPDFLEWAVDVPDAPRGGFSLRPATLEGPSFREVPNEELDWAPSRLPEPTVPIQPTPAPNPRRPAPGDEGSVLTNKAVEKSDAASGQGAKHQTNAASLTYSDAPDAELSFSWEQFARSFAKGAHLPQNSLAPASPDEFAERLGRLMLLVVENVRQLLKARQQARRFGRSQNQTMIQAVDNNPLKFSPNSEDALRIMFGHRTSSYLDAGYALQEGFNDIKAHQIKTLSAMQAALMRLAEDFDPKSIEGSLEPDGGISGFMGSRKARLWDTYTARWQATTRRREDGMLQAFMLRFAEYYDLVSEEEKS